MNSFLRFLALLAPLLLTACAANQMPGYQQVYHSYTIPQPLLDRIAYKFKEHGLHRAKVERDNVGRVRLGGVYQNEDEVDRAFVIVQSIVGIKSTSPFYPQDIKEKRWDKGASEAIANTASEREAKKQTALLAPRKRALVIGVNTFMDADHLPAIQGEDDAMVVREHLARSGYIVTDLLGSKATKHNIEEAIKVLEREIRPQDTLFIYISSHGTAPVQSSRGQDHRKMSIIAYDSGDINGQKSRDRTDLALKVQQTSVSDTLVQKLAQKPTKITRVMIDTCYSGEILRDVSDPGAQYILSVNGGKPEQEGISMAAWSGAEYTSKAIRFVDDAPLPAVKGKTAAPRQAGEGGEIDRNRPGYTIITATSEGQESLGPPHAVGVFDSPLAPGKKLRGSFFTQSFFDFLEASKGEIAPAFERARKFTGDKAVEVTAGKKQQIPRQFSTLPPDQNNLFL